jgi:hypothetical protein
MARQQTKVFHMKRFFAIALMVLGTSISDLRLVASEPLQFGRPIYLTDLVNAGEWVQSVGAADLNRDGNLDLVVGVGNLPPGDAHVITVAMGNGDGRFKTPARYVIPLEVNSLNYAPFVSALKIVDLDKDGVPDVIKANSSSLSWFRGIGNGSFSAVANLIPTRQEDDLYSFFFTDIEIGDFGHRWKDDILALSFGSGGLFGSFPSRLVVFSPTNGVFVDTQQLDLGPTEFPQGPFFKFLAKGDFNRDGKLDFVAEGYDGLLRVYLGTGNETFEEGFSSTNVGDSFAENGTYVTGMELSDVNGDGLPDVLIERESNAVSHAIDFFSVAPTNASLGVFLGKANGTFSREITNVFKLPIFYAPDHTDAYHSFSVCDVNGDGLMDVITDGWNSVIALLGNGDGTFPVQVEISKLPFHPFQIVARDFNTDGKIDLFLSGMRGDDLRHDSTASCILLNGAAVQMEKGDIFWQNADGRLAFWQMDGTNCFGAIAIAGTNLNSIGHALALNDFNHDGHDDILFQQPDGRLVIGFLNGTTVTRTQVFAAANAVPRGWQFSGLADFNNDGKKDLLWNTGQGLVAWMLDGTRIIGERSIETGLIFPNAQLLGTADFNHDGSTDLLWLNNGAVTVSFLSRGSYRYSTYLNGGKRVSRGWKVGGIGDLNGDGWPDILWRHDDGRLVAWLLNGTRIVEFVPLRPGRPVSPSWRIVGVE